MNILYSSSSEESITSLAVIVSGYTKVYICSHCGHIATSSIFDLEQYYDTEYKINALNVDEDDLYDITDGRMVFRSEHMSRIFQEKMGKYGIKILLDYGCGKSLTSKCLMDANADLDVYLFDVSHDYVEFWKKFRTLDKYACFTPPTIWAGSFDCVTSFFSFEHVPSPLDTMLQIRSLLKTGGLLYTIVPNIYSVNRADLLVVDHLHHYSLSSMKLALFLCGFELIEVDNHSHQQASIYIARAVEIHSTRSDAEINFTEVKIGIKEMQKLADYWKNIDARLIEFEEQIISLGSKRLFIYGAGIVGLYLYSKSHKKQNITGFIDSNQHKQRKDYCGLPVYSPLDVSLMPSDALLVGLNAGVGESVIGSMRQFDLLGKNIFYC